jgi:putative phage-type endonuclease
MNIRELGECIDWVDQELNGEKVNSQNIDSLITKLVKKSLRENWNQENARLIIENRLNILWECNEEICQPASEDQEDQESDTEIDIDPSVLSRLIKRSQRDDIEVTPDRVMVGCAEDLISRRYDYPESRFKKKEHLRRLGRVIAIDNIPQHEQKSKEWLMQRHGCLTATAVAIVLDHDPYKYPFELLLDKCGLAPPFEENENVHHGKKYEEIGTMYYSYRNNVQVGEYGLIQHVKKTFIAASPDGICQKKRYHEAGLTALVGRLLEIKFPSKRKIVTEGRLDGDLCPHHYYVQCQTQLYVTELDECDFLQCEVDEYDSWKEYLDDSVDGVPGLSAISGLEKGCLIQLLPRKMISGPDQNMCLYHGAYIYPPRLHMNPSEIKDWISQSVLEFPDNHLSKDFMIDKIIYWRLRKVSCNLVKADTTWFENIIPMLRQFWDYVEFYRKNMNLMKKLQGYAERVGMGSSAEIFERINREYLEANPDSDYQPLYSETNPWREAAEVKRAKNAKYQEYLKRRNAKN